MAVQNINRPAEAEPAHQVPIHAPANTRVIFIVGVSRSGTTLMRNILNRSDQIAISRENHFLGHLVGSEGVRYQIKKFGELTVDENVRKLADFIYAGGLERSSRFRKASAHWRWITRRIDKEVFIQRILESDRSERAFFVILMQLFAERKGKPIMGEKTPAHFRYAPTLLSWFPEAKIIHMLRDPRGIFISEYRRRKKEASSFPYRQLRRLPALLKLYVLVQTTITWRESIRTYRQYQQQYPQNYYGLRFEDLVRDPRNQIQQVSTFLGVPFQEQMLDQTVVSNGFQENQTGFDAEAAERWRKHIEPWINNWYRFWFGHQLKEMGYPD